MVQKLPGIILVNRAFIIHNQQTLAVRRTPTNRNNGGLWEVPGGKLEKRQSQLDALTREVLEETGLDIQPVDTIVHSESKVIVSDDTYDGMTYVSLFSLATIVAGTLQLSDEHDDFRWCTYDTFMKLDLTPTSCAAATALKDRLRLYGVT